VSDPLYRRREVLGASVGAAVALGFGAAFWQGAFDTGDGGPPPRGESYGALGDVDANGLRLPAGFEARLVARGEETVEGTDYAWHLASDGAATFSADGGWILVSNSEVPEGGASAIRFGAGGEIEDAYRILEGTAQNCSGGPTPWGTWLSCEEIEAGRVWECDPTGERPAQVHEAMGVFYHEAVAVDPLGRQVYLTEDLDDGAFYRYTPERWPDLSSGLLEAARVADGGAVEWVEVPDPNAADEPTRSQVSDTGHFERAEGIWFDAGTVYVATTINARIHAYDTAAERVEVIYDGLAVEDPPLLRVDNITASPVGELFVCEDSEAEEIRLGVMTQDRTVTPFLVATGENHLASELTGPAFDPSGSRFYFTSQRANQGQGEVYEVTGPFRGRRRSGS